MNHMKKILIFIIIVLLVFIVIKLNKKEVPQNNTRQEKIAESQYKTVTADSYSFQIPVEWVDVGPKDFEGCRWHSVVNNDGDGHRQNGEIGIYKKVCFDLTKSLGKKEVEEKDGYYIIAYYDKDSGTTPEEETETKAVHQKIVSTFSGK